MLFWKEQKHFNYNRIVSGIILLCISAITGIMIVYNMLIIEGNPVMTKVFLRSMEMKRDEFQIEILNPFEQPDISDDQTISCWENAGNYFFFLPAAWSDDKLYWIFNLEDKICVDGKEIFNGSEVSLAEGTHELELSSGEKLPVEIIYSGNISSMYIKIRGGVRRSRISS